MHPKDPLAKLLSNNPPAAIALPHDPPASVVEERQTVDYTGGDFELTSGFGEEFCYTFGDVPRSTHSTLAGWNTLV
jgi:hypothetical protein